MKTLPYVVENPEIRQNFEVIEESLAVVQLADLIVAAEVGGTKAKKVALLDSRGKFLGYIPLYSA